MKTHLRATILVFCLLAFTASARALTFENIFFDSGEKFWNGTVAGKRPSRNTTGAGNLEDIFENAAKVWANAIGNPYYIRVEYGWAPLTGTIRAQTNAVWSGPVLHVVVIFDNDGSTRWFFDPSPESSNEYSIFKEYSASLNGYKINTGREFTSGQSGTYDLLTVASHEIAHALDAGRSVDLTQLELTSPRPYSGAVLPIRKSEDSSGHLDEKAMRGAFSHAVSAWSATGIRRLPSDADILFVAEIVGFNDLRLSPLPNLVFYKPYRWHDKIDAHYSKSTKRWNVDWAVLNKSISAGKDDFTTSIYLDADPDAINDQVRLEALVPLRTWRETRDISPQKYIFRMAQDIGRLSRGRHTLTMVTDVFKELDESRGSDNSHTIEIEVP